MRVLVLGGDGYLGWPTALRLSAGGHDLAVVDNFLRRAWHLEQGTESLTPIRQLHERIDAWRQVGGRTIRAFVGDINDYQFLDSVIETVRPEALIHYGEHSSAPWSMQSRRNAIATQANNVLGTLNVLFALRDRAPDCHLVKLGTMGEYGTPNIDIEEGFIDIEHLGRRDRLPFPKQPGSLYHLSKVHDSNNIMFACRAWRLRSTDLNQGVVYGMETDETVLDERLCTRFDYDECFGTVLNRFCVQAATGHPLTVYGSGRQVRAFLNIRDTVRAVELTIMNPPGPGEYRVFNQFTQQFEINELAAIVQRAGARSGLRVRVQPVADPRVEAQEHYYNARHTSLLELGLVPTMLTLEEVGAMLEVVGRYRERVNPRAIMPRIRWDPRPATWAARG